MYEIYERPEGMNLRESFDVLIEMTDKSLNIKNLFRKKIKTNMHG